MQNLASIPLLGLLLLGDRLLGRIAFPRLRCTLEEGEEAGEGEGEEGPFLGLVPVALARIRHSLDAAHLAHWHRWAVSML